MKEFSFEFVRHHSSALAAPVNLPGSEMITKSLAVGDVNDEGMLDIMVGNGNVRPIKLICLTRGSLLLYTTKKNYSKAWQVPVKMASIQVCRKRTAISSPKHSSCPENSCFPYSRSVE